MIIIIGTIVLLITIAIFTITINLINKQNTEDSLDTFVYSFLGGLTEGFIGIIVGFTLAYIIVLVTSSTSSIFIYGNQNEAITVMIVFFACWFLCTICGEIITIKPIIKLFSGS